MKNRIEMQVKCKNDWLVLDQTDKEKISKLASKNDKKYVTLILQETRSKRRVEANAYYWGVIIKAFQREWPDYSQQQIHDTLGEQFRKFRKNQHVIKKEIDLKAKYDSKYIWTEKDNWHIEGSSQMSVYEFWYYCEQCTVMLAEIGGYLDVQENKIYEKIKGMF